MRQMEATTAPFPRFPLRFLSVCDALAFEEETFRQHKAGEGRNWG